MKYNESFFNWFQFQFRNWLWYCGSNKSWEREVATVGTNSLYCGNQLTVLWEPTHCTVGTNSLYCGNQLTVLWEPTHCTVGTNSLYCGNQLTVLWEPTHRRRSAGRPKPTYVDVLKKDAGAESTNELARCMENRDDWKCRWRARLRTTWWWWSLEITTINERKT